MKNNFSIIGCLKCNDTPYYIGERNKNLTALVPHGE
jgi:hypothetical protein